jgi:hypothetical protein
MLSLSDKSYIAKISSQFLFTAMFVLCLVIMLIPRNSRQTNEELANHKSEKCENCQKIESDSTKNLSDTTKR